ncbi:MAG: hypothetical protein ABI334_01405 [Candidatus Dormiibacterota bacterium]
MVGTIAGAVIGASVFATFTGLGFLLSSRLGVSPLVPILVLAVVGAYAGWLVGVIVFGAVRGAPTKEEQS